MAMTADWQSDGTLVECLGHMLRESVGADVTFLLGQNQDVVKAHKAILISRSPVFFAMLEGPLAEKAEIAIPDISKSTFCSLLEYLYTDILQLKINTVTPLLYAAKKYLVNRLVKECTCFLDKIIRIQNAATLLEEAHRYCDQELQQKCFGVIKTYPAGFLKTDDFTKLCSVCLMAVIDLNDLLVEEERVYEAVLRWSEAECKRQNLDVTDGNIRHILGDVIYAVRFPLMNATYFAREVCSRDILTAEENVAVIRFCHKKGNVLLKKFKTEKRGVPQLLKTINRADIFSQIKDITGVTEDNYITEAISACQDEKGKYDIQDVVSILIEDSVASDKNRTNVKYYSLSLRDIDATRVSKQQSNRK